MMTELLMDPADPDYLKSLNFKSCIKFYGRPILPPVLWAPVQDEIQKFKQQASMVEAKLKEQANNAKSSAVQELSTEEGVVPFELLDTELETVDVLQHESACTEDEMQHKSQTESTENSTAIKDIPVSLDHVNNNITELNVVVSGQNNALIEYKDNSSDNEAFITTVMPENSKNTSCETADDYCEKSNANHPVPINNAVDLDEYKKLVSEYEVIFRKITDTPLQPAIGELIDLCDDSSGSCEQSSETDEQTFNTVVPAVTSSGNNVCDSDNASIATSCARSSDLSKYLDSSMDEGLTSDTSPNLINRSSDSCNPITESTSCSEVTLADSSSTTPLVPLCLDNWPCSETSVNDPDPKQVLLKSPSSSQTVNDNSAFCVTPFIAKAVVPKDLNNNQEQERTWLKNLLKKAQHFSDTKVKQVPDIETDINSSRESCDAVSPRGHVRQHSYTLEAPSPVLVHAHSSCQCSNSPDKAQPHSIIICPDDANTAGKILPTDLPLAPMQKPSTSTGHQKTDLLNSNSEPDGGSSPYSTTPTNVKLVELSDTGGDDDGTLEMSSSYVSSSAESSPPEALLGEMFEKIKEIHKQRVERLAEEQNKQWTKLQQEFKAAQDLLYERFHAMKLQSHKGANNTVNLLDSPVPAISMSPPSTTREKSCKQLPMTPISSARALLKGNGTKLNFKGVSDESCTETIKIISIDDPAIKKKFEKVTAVAKGFLVRRLMKTERVKDIVRTIKDTAALALSLHDECLKNGAIVGYVDYKEDLHRSLANQLEKACNQFYDLFFNTSIKEQMAVIAETREMRKGQQAAKRLAKLQTEKNVSSGNENASEKPQMCYEARKLSSATLKALERKNQKYRRNLENRAYSVNDIRLPKVSGTRLNVYKRSQSKPQLSPSPKTSKALSPSRKQSATGSICQLKHHEKNLKNDAFSKPWKP